MAKKKRATPRHYRRLDRKQTLKLAAWIEGNKDRLTDSDYDVDKYIAVVREELGLDCSWPTIRNIAKELGVQLTPVRYRRVSIVSPKEAEDLILGMALHLKFISDDLGYASPVVINEFLDKVVGTDSDES